MPFDSIPIALSPLVRVSTGIFVCLASTFLTTAGVYLTRFVSLSERHFALCERIDERERFGDLDVMVEYLGRQIASKTK